MTVSQLPDSESDYHLTKHYTDDSRNRSNPDVTDDVVDTLLNDSVCRESDVERYSDRYLLQAEIDGYEWVLVVADDRSDDEEYDWALITIFSNYHGSVGTTNRYFDRKRSERGDME